jgi:hypothetical protein
MFDGTQGRSRHSGEVSLMQGFETPGSPNAVESLYRLPYLGFPNIYIYIYIYINVASLIFRFSIKLEKLLEKPLITKIYKNPLGSAWAANMWTCGHRRVQVNRQMPRASGCRYNKTGAINDVVGTAESDFSVRVSRKSHVLSGVNNSRLSDPEDEQLTFLRRFGNYLLVDMS